MARVYRNATTAALEGRSLSIGLPAPYNAPLRKTAKRFAVPKSWVRKMQQRRVSMSEKAPRSAKVERNTNETQISVAINLDGTGKLRCETGLPFLDHMLDQIARHGLIDIEINAKGDLEIDAHHTVEDIGITLGQAFSQALDKTGIRRYGHAYVPLDEALSRVVIDFSGRPGLEYHVQFVKGTVGNFDVDLFHEFFQGFVNHALATLHIDNLRGKNAHHQIETIFKAFGRAVRMATELDPRSVGVVPSTKGSL